MSLSKPIQVRNRLAFHLKVTLLGSSPPIWRRVLIPGNLTLAKLHDILQRAMGWTNSHLHMFEVGPDRYAEPDPEWGDVGDHHAIRLCDAAPQAGDKFVYIYDIGDGWQHEIEVEEITPTDGSQKIGPVCLAGARACPPEDCGGIGGYAELLEALSDPKHERHEELSEWIGGEFDPEAFDLSEINKALGRRRK
ncbi:MAG: hypothetical protein AUJ52_14765 [Elusimicrobia bacterium CG1_02_63_36]|nr:MAG: hypothetical protein AUJ52_14765 [Elusimicrobia bacterium CG1_02_63_36]PIP82141.1 MAG: hypothetical protein COR54_16435 [Elusimicrobia bacterium CG22_combo_CG10-13_8_21_14_all_63_91]PJB24137.1 MAG: hypothetical protein CO113_15495 [Elusimicrobia bacterium CG_4_9_14_3_um_filter_62_55]